MSSDVLRSLNEEVTKTKLEKDKENRQWSTFLQRPNRPVPKSKQSLEAERRAANAYKVTIVKSAPREKSPMVSEWMHSEKSCTKFENINPRSLCAKQNFKIKMQNDMHDDMF